MIFKIAKKESLEMLRDGRYLWASGVVFTLLLAALLAGWKHYSDVEQQRAISQNEDREIWLNQGDKNQHSAAHFGAYAFKPSSALTAIDQGVLAYTGTSVFMEAHSVKDAAYRPIEDATAVQRLGNLTASSTLQLLLPLLIILLAFGAFAGEREQGTLRQLMSLGVPLRSLTLGKMLGVLAPLMLILVPASVIGVTAMALSAYARDIPLWEGGRTGLLMLAYLLYFLIFVVLSLLVSARAASSRQALITLLGFWFVTSFIVPRLATDLADAFHPIPTPQEFQQAIDEDMDALPSWTDRTKAVQTRLMTEHSVASVEEIPASVAGHTLLEAEHDETQVYRKHFEQLGEQYDAQRGLTQAAAVVSPYLAINMLSMGLAGSDYAHHRHFVEAAEEYRYTLVQTLNQDLIDQDGDWDFLADRSMWERIPAFAYDVPNTTWVLSLYGLSLAALFFWTVLVVALFVPTLSTLKIG